MPETALTVQEVHQRYDDVWALGGVSCTVEAGSVVALVGPSGCGKSTLLRLIAGLETPTEGTITLTGQVGRSRLGQVGYMPQSDALLPWRSIIDNVVLGAEIDGRRREGIKRARDLLQEFGLGGFEQRYPAELSGGMRQRAALIRTFLTDRNLILLDEPLSALDALTRRALQGWLLELWQYFGYTVLLVTHDVREAVTLADAVLVMSPRPGTIRERVAIDLPRPRQTSADAFTHKVREIEQLLIPSET